jgi:hypothetical protein
VKTDARAEAAEAREARLREALQKLISAIGAMRVPQTKEEAAMQVMVTIGPVLKNARAALEAKEGGE